MTNYEKIKSMNIDEMAEFMFNMVDCISCTHKLKRSNDVCNGDGKKCLKVTKEWLKKDVKY
ncbi:hypothetical protein D3C73_1656080 [compost metagenome]